MQPSLIWGGCLALFIATVSAEDAVRTYRIPPQPLASALEAFSRQADVEMFFPDEAVQGKQSPGLAGPYTPRQAMQKLLAGTGLSYTFTAEDSVAVRVAETEATPDAEGPEPKPAAEQGATELPEMTVTASPLDDTSYNPPNATTATKTDTPIMETPVSIQVIPQQVLKDQQVIRLNKALQNVSGVYNSGGGSLQGGQTRFSLRGFDTGFFGGTLYRDGFRNQAGAGAPEELANIDRVEVLKGPAAILYGRGEPGGLINLVTKQPLSERYYAFEQQFGSFDLYRTTLDATGPLTKDDTLLYRFNAAYVNEGSFVEGDGAERVFVAPALRWNITPRTQANLYLEYEHDETIGNNSGLPALGGRPAPVPREQVFQETSEPNDFDFLRVGFNWSHAFTERWTLRHRFEYQHRDLFFPPTASVDVGNIDEDLGEGQCTRQQCLLPRAVFASKSLSSSYNLTLDLIELETFGLKHRLLLGGEYWRFDLSQVEFSYAAPPIDLFRPVPTGVPPVPDTFTEENGLFQLADDGFSDFFGFYVQDQVEFPHRVHLLAGFRYDNAGSVFDTFTADASGTGFSTSKRPPEDAVTPRFGLLWQALPQLSLYGNYTDGSSLTRF